MDEVPIGWRYEPMSALGSFFKGRGGPRRDDEPSGVPVVRYGQLYTHHDEVIRNFYSFVAEERAHEYFRLRVGDLLFAGSGETASDIGKAAVFLGPEPAVAGGDTIIFRPNGLVYPRFLGYASNGSEAGKHKLAVAQGSSVVHIRVCDLAQLRIPLPPYQEQQKIAAVLSAVDDATVATRKVIAQTKRVKQDFLKTLMTRGLGHTRFKKTPIGVIPAAWGVKRLADLGRRGTKTIRSGPFGSSLKREHFTNEGRPILTIQSLGEGEVEEEGLYFVSPEKARELRDYEVQPGDLVFSRVADIGRSIVIENHAAGWIISSNLIRITPDRQRVNSRYLMYCIVGGGPVTRQIGRLTGEQGRPVVSSTMLQDLHFPVPPKHEQDALVSRIQVVEDTCRRAEASVEHLEQLKRGLLQDLLTGRVRVPLD